MPAQTPCAADDASLSASMDSDTGGVEQDKAIGSSCYNAVTGQEERHVPMLGKKYSFQMCSILYNKFSQNSRKNVYMISAE